MFWFIIAHERALNRADSIQITLDEVKKRRDSLKMHVKDQDSKIHSLQSVIQKVSILYQQNLIVFSL